MVRRAHALRLFLVVAGLTATTRPVTAQGGFGPLGPGPAVTEFLARNDDGLQDEDGDASDWIEVHNVFGAGPVDLGGWSLTDDAADPSKWTFQAGTVVLAGDFLVVFASSKDRRDPAGTLHTNFRLAGSGEYLALVDPFGAIVTEYGPEYPPQEEDVSYGLTFLPAPSGTQRMFVSPTPGGPNPAGGPPVWGASHTPEQPLDSETVTVTVHAPTLALSAPTVDLVTRVMYAPSQSVPMLDDGVAPDAVANDGIYTAVIPASLSGPGEMVRYRVEASDAAGFTEHPHFVDPLGSPEWFGTVVVDPSHAGSPLDVWEWFVENPGAATTNAGTRCSMWIEGRFYDNVRVSRRGASSGGYPRKSFKFDFNPDHRPVLAAVGVEIDEANLNTHWSDKAHVRQMLAYHVLAAAGSPASLSFPVRLQQNGEFYSVQTFIEEPDRFFLERSGEDPEGALYKMYNTFNSGTTGVEKVTRLHESNADLQAFVSRVLAGGAGMEDYLFDTIDVPKVLCYLAGLWMFHENDHVHKNHFLYRDSDGDGEWCFVPWDKDLTWGRNYHLGIGGVLNDQLTHSHPIHSHPLLGDAQHVNTDNFWNRLIDRVYESPRLREMYLRRLRTVSDELLQHPSTPPSELWMEDRINGAYALMAADVALDEQRWGIPTWGTPRNFQQAKDRMIAEYVVPRRGHLYGSLQVANGGIVPDGARRSGLRVAGFDPSTGDRTQSYIELVNDSGTASDLSGYQVEGAVTMTLPAGTVVEAGGRLFLAADVAAFRARPISPHGGEGHFVQGPFVGTADAGELLFVRDERGRARVRTRL